MDRNILAVVILPWFGVVPYVGTWIEIRPIRLVIALVAVVPYVGTWIEIMSAPVDLAT